MVGTWSEKNGLKKGVLKAAHTLTIFLCEGPPLNYRPTSHITRTVLQLKSQSIHVYNGPNVYLGQANRFVWYVNLKGHTI